MSLCILKVLQAQGTDRGGQVNRVTLLADGTISPQYDGRTTQYFVGDPPEAVKRDFSQRVADSGMFPAGFTMLVNSLMEISIHGVGE